MTKRKFKVPHTLVVLFSMVILAQILTYVIPAGSFDRVENNKGQKQVVPGSFHLTPEKPALSPAAIIPKRTWRKSASIWKLTASKISSKTN